MKQTVVELGCKRTMAAINKKIPETRKHNSFIKEDRIISKKLQNQYIKKLSFI